MTQEAAIKFKDEIKAFQEGKQIQVFTRKWVDDNNPSFSIKSKYRVKPVEEPEQKRIIELSDDGKTWFEATRFIPKCENLHVRVRVETQPTKRLPTIEEVEKWFLENKVFVYKVANKNILHRIQSFDKRECEIDHIQIGSYWRSIEDFCSEYSHLDGSSLYITE